ncbi:MAG: alginate export family protein [Thermodesulfobacteriota bacterium]
MKRILLSVFAVAITAAWAVPASAADVTFGGQYRVRGEYRDNQDFNDNADDSISSATQRVRLTAKANATDDTSVKITLQDTRLWGQNTGVLTDSGGATAENNTLDLHEAYVNVNNLFGTSVSVRAGRQELNYGDQRLIGAFGWSNNGRAFDGVKLNYSNDMVNVDAFNMTITADTSTATDDDTTLSGVYLTVPKAVPNNTVDLYVINKRDNTAMSLYTFGARVKGAFNAIDYTAEAAFQSGDQSSTVSYDASAFAVKAGYTLPTPMKIRIGAEYDFATGDDGTTTTDNEAFQILYPTDHGHFGIADVAGVNHWTNLQAWSLNAKANVNEQLSVYAAYWDFTEEETSVAANGDDLGNEVDLVATYKYNKAVNVQAGYAIFSPDTAKSGAGNPDDSENFAYLMLTANF